MALAPGGLALTVLALNLDTDRQATSQPNTAWDPFKAKTHEVQPHHIFNQHMEHREL